MSRYSDSQPKRYYELPFVMNVWFGPRHFYVSSHYQSKKHEGDETEIPKRLPQFEPWLSKLGNPVASAYNPSTKLRFCLWITRNPRYAFAIQAQVVEHAGVADTYVYSVSDLEAWEVSNGLDREDLASTSAGNWVERLVARGMNALMQKVNPPMIGFNTEEWREWHVWGGEWPQQ